MNTDQIPLRDFLQMAGIGANAAFLTINALSAAPSDDLASDDLGDDDLNGSNSVRKEATKIRRDRRCHKR